MTKAERYEQYRASKTWKRLRERALERDGHRCQHPDCEKRTTLQVHHKRYPRVLGREPLEWLVTLCREHHQEVHSRPVIRDGIEFRLTRLPDAGRWAMMRKRRKRKASQG